MGTNSGLTWRRGDRVEHVMALEQDGLGTRFPYCVVLRADGRGRGGDAHLVLIRPEVDPARSPWPPTEWNAWCLRLMPAPRMEAEEVDLLEAAAMLLCEALGGADISAGRAIASPWELQRTAFYRLAESQERGRP